jgi:hypothetical protein
MSDGTLWVVIGDKYAAFRDSKLVPDTLRGHDMRTAVAYAPNRNPQAMKAAGLKHKDMILIPFMLAVALRDDGWYLRDTIISCLSP